MAKVEAIVGRALRLIGVVDPRQPLQEADLKTGITALNAMMTRWEADTLSMGWTNVSAPDEDMPCPPEAEEAITFNLAATLAPEYSQQASAEVLSVAMAGLDKLRRDVYVSSPIYLRGNRPRRFNIYTDDYN